MNNPESILEKVACKILWDFETQTDHLISARQSDFVTVNDQKKKKEIKICQIVDHRVKLKKKRKDR